MYSEGKLVIGKSDRGDDAIYPKMANRHGLIAGATGTGKTTTVKTVAEAFSEAGVSVFLADVKGDLSGIAKAADGMEGVKYPTNIFDVYGEMGMPLRTTISEMGPTLLSRILDLNQTQSDLLAIVFKIADDEGLLLIDIKDLRSMLTYVNDNASEYSSTYGNIAKSSITTIIRALIALESEGGDMFFGEPAIDINDWIATDASGRGYIQVLDCQKLILNPTMYSTLLLWMLSEIYETLPEVGDMDRPKLVFFFDEAHMLFDNASRALLSKIEQVVKLIRSKGVGIYFITQNPSDIPNGVLAQLGNKIQHALHAYTPAEQKAIKAAADSFRVNPEFKTAEKLEELGIGEALVSVLDEAGVPTVVEITKINLPHSSMKPINMNERDDIVYSSPLFDKYSEAVDRHSAYEELTGKSNEGSRYGKNAAIESYEKAYAEEDEDDDPRKAYARAHKISSSTGTKAGRSATKTAKSSARTAKSTSTGSGRRQKSASEKIVRSVANTAAGTIGREVGNSFGKSVGGSFGKRLGGNVGATLARGIMGTFLK